ncbi:MAG: spermidine/putrescine ABC transporter substrate-binding protein [Deltaproteobacteria bacterium]|nr:spermidine/putrescine ABC transporter substrate-binding protein [Deltaproteobacteria bacterium]
MKMKNLGKVGMALFFSIVFTMGVLSGALAEGKYKDYPVPKACMDQVRKEGSRLFIYDWAEWWPEDLFANFTKEFGIKITRDHFADSEEMVTKIKLNPKAPYDLVTGIGPEHVMRLKGLGLVRQLNHDWLPNVDAYLEDQYKKLPYDPGNHFQIGDSVYFTTYTYNSKYVDPNDPLIPSWKLLFEGKKYAGKITMIDNMFETVGTALKYLGYSYNSVNEKELEEARKVLLKQKPMVMAYDSWPRRLLVEEEAWISHLWVGDSWLLHQDMPTILGALPTEGTFMALNTDFLPIGGKHPAAAHLFLNYLFRTDVNAKLIQWIGYPPVHKHVMELMSDEMKKWPGFIIKPEYAKKCDIFDIKAVTGRGRELRAKIWEELKK